MTYVVHLIITDCDRLPTNHEIFMQVEADRADLATDWVITWHRDSFGDMTVNHVATREGALTQTS